MHCTEKRKKTHDARKRGEELISAWVVLVDAEKG
jgi:hypothetical protein